MNCWVSNCCYVSDPTTLVIQILELKGELILTNPLEGADLLCIFMEEAREMVTGMNRQQVIGIQSTVIHLVVMAPMAPGAPDQEA